MDPLKIPKAGGPACLSLCLYPQLGVTFFVILHHSSFEMLGWNRPPKTPSWVIFFSCVLWCSHDCLKALVSYLQALHILLHQTGFPKFPISGATDSVVQLFLVLGVEDSGLS